MEISNDKTESAAGSSSNTPPASSVADESLEITPRPICMIVLGMAGSGKTTFVKKITQFGHLQNMKPYVVNLDPACSEVPYHANIGEDISITCENIMFTAMFIQFIISFIWQTFVIQLITKK